MGLVKMGLVSFMRFKVHYASCVMAFLASVIKRLIDEYVQRTSPFDANPISPPRKEQPNVLRALCESIPAGSRVLALIDPDVGIHISLEWAILAEVHGP